MGHQQLAVRGRMQAAQHKLAAERPVANARGCSREVLSPNTTKNGAIPSSLPISVVISFGSILA